MDEYCWTINSDSWFKVQYLNIVKITPAISLLLLVYDLDLLLKYCYFMHFAKITKIMTLCFLSNRDNCKPVNISGRGEIIQGMF